MRFFIGKREVTPEVFREACACNRWERDPFVQAQQLITSMFALYGGIPTSMHGEAYGANRTFKGRQLSASFDKKIDELRKKMDTSFNQGFDAFTRGCIAAHAKVAARENGLNEGANYGTPMLSVPEEFPEQVTRRCKCMEGVPLIITYTPTGIIK